MKKFNELGKILTPDEQMKIMGGLLDPGGGGEAHCLMGMSCGVYNSSNGQTYYGSCAFVNSGGNNYFCECSTSLGYYVPSGISVCSSAH
jgi:hypothetical protein